MKEEYRAFVRNSWFLNFEFSAPCCFVSVFSPSKILFGSVQDQIIGFESGLIKVSVWMNTLRSSPPHSIHFFLKALQFHKWSAKLQMFKSFLPEDFSCSWKNLGFCRRGLSLSWLFFSVSLQKGLRKHFSRFFWMGSFISVRCKEMVFRSWKQLLFLSME